MKKLNEMTFNEAGKCTLPFGNYKGEKICDVALTDKGLKYLDWMVGLENIWPKLKIALTVFLNDPSIKKELQDLL